jgi:transcriptional regulator with XRE-family HTH domain
MRSLGRHSPPEVLYTPDVDRERYRREALRLAAILRREIRRQGISIRSLEQKMGVGNSVYQKVLGGKITMTLGHLLQIADALGLEWQELFSMAYPGQIQPVEAAPPAETEEFDRKVMDVLRRHGLIPERAVSRGT